MVMIYLSIFANIFFNTNISLLLEQILKILGLDVHHEKCLCLYDFGYSLPLKLSSSQPYKDKAAVLNSGYLNFQCQWWNSHRTQVSNKHSYRLEVVVQSCTSKMWNYATYTDHWPWILDRDTFVSAPPPPPKKKKKLPVWWHMWFQVVQHRTLLRWNSFKRSTIRSRSSLRLDLDLNWLFEFYLATQKTACE